MTWAEWAVALLVVLLKSITAGVVMFVISLGIKKAWGRLARRRLPAVMRHNVPRDGGRGTPRECHVVVAVGRMPSGRYGAMMLKFAPPTGVWTTEDAT